MKNTTVIEDFPNFATTGAYVNGFSLEGAGWEMGRGDEQGYLVDQQLKDLHPEVPIIHVTAIRRETKQLVGIYDCPVYSTTGRGPTFVFTAGLQMESEDHPVSKWILAGVAMVLAPE